MFESAADPPREMVYVHMGERSPYRVVVYFLVIYVATGMQHSKH